MGVEVPGMRVILPVQADVTEDERVGRRQIHIGGALVRLCTHLSTSNHACKSNKRFPSYFEPHSPDIIGFELRGVLEVGLGTLDAQLPVHDVALFTARLACVEEGAGQ